MRRTALILATVMSLALGTVASFSGTADEQRYPTLVGVRYAQHSTFDRVVLDFDGATPSWSAKYGTLVTEGEGRAVDLAGNATLVVRMTPARAHDGNYNSTYQLRTLSPGFRSLKQIGWGGDYEGYLTLGLGLRDMVPYKVYALTSPPRLVVDVQHATGSSWTVAPVTKSGTAPKVVVSGVRTGRHTGYDRLVFDVKGTAKPATVVRYSGDTSLLLVKFTAAGTSSSAPHASYGGPSPITMSGTAVRTVRLGYAEDGVLIFRVSTARRNGFRVSVLTSPVRVVVDVRH